MRLTKIYARFYRSLNYDYHRANHKSYSADPWDDTLVGPFPFVRLDLSDDITTIVGANEAGKSQVLRAVEAALTGENYSESDFCRYSRFFGIDGAIAKPEFGAAFDGVSREDLTSIEKSTGHRNLPSDTDSIAIFRMNSTPLHRLYAHSTTEGWSKAEHVKNPTQLAADLHLPIPFRIDATIPLPDSVPLHYLTRTRSLKSNGRRLRNAFETLDKEWLASPASIQENAEAIFDRITTPPTYSQEDLARFDLAVDLLIKISGLQPSLFAQLQDAALSKNGFAASLVKTINESLGRALNLSHWWSQDSKFSLSVSLRDLQLVFMLDDRTGGSYSFAERSDGMKYFLSYLVQYLAHEARTDGRPEILLMDEPDQFLSSSGQQDLLRIFDDFAQPRESKRAAIPVIYVTHSPFLIDKNAAHRIRVLDKGEYDEGTRVIHNASANHYEPLRSALGGFVAETTFLGNCNLMIEGVSDQVLIAGATRWLKRELLPDADKQAYEILDLNQVTLVPAGGTRHIPYLVYLARGRDADKPSVVVLLDGDKDGDDAREDVRRGGAYGEDLLPDRFVYQLGHGPLTALTQSFPDAKPGIEDLLPLNIAVAAAIDYCRQLVPGTTWSHGEVVEAVVNSLTTVPGLKAESGLFKRLEETMKGMAATQGYSRFHLDKIALARSTVAILESSQLSTGVQEEDLATAQTNFAALLAVLSRAARDAIRLQVSGAMAARLKRTRREFVSTHGSETRKEDVLLLLEDMTVQIESDNSREANTARAAMREITRDFDLQNNSREYVADHAALIAALSRLAL